MASVAKTVEISAQSTESFEAACQAAVQRAGKTIKNIQSAWVKEEQLVIKDNRVSAYRVHLKITFLVGEGGEV